MSSTIDRITRDAIAEGSVGVYLRTSRLRETWQRASCCGPSRASLFGVDMARPGGDSTVYSWQTARPIQPKEKLEYSDIKVSYVTVPTCTIEIPARYLEIEGECVEVDESKVLYLQES